MDLLINSIENENVLNSYNFARKSDLVYSEIISKRKFQNIDTNDTTIISEDKHSIFYKKNKFELKENDIIFCNSFTIDSLFDELNKIDTLKNLKLITHQSDMLISHKLFKKKPQCISEWHSINVDNNISEISPLPMGLSNDYFGKTLDKSHYTNEKRINFEDKENKLYVNFEVNTNFSERYKLIKLFQKKPWAVVEDEKLTLNEYVTKLNKYRFILCPWGNGIDTHRLWETFYAGSVPITRRHDTYIPTKTLPIILIDNYKNISFDELCNFTLKKHNEDALTINYWIKKINNNILDINQKIYITESQIKQEDTIGEYNKMLSNIRRIKKFKTLDRKIKKRIF